MRPPVAERKFISDAVEATIKQMKATLPNKELAWMFENCFPNTLDTTVFYEENNGSNNGIGALGWSNIRISV